MFALFAMRSYPAGVRGLKLSLLSRQEWMRRSYPAGVRGLKHFEIYGPESSDKVVSRRGTWGETVCRDMYGPERLSYPTGVRGLKQKRDV